MATGRNIVASGELLTPEGVTRSQATKPPAYGQLAVYKSADTEDCHVEAVVSFSRYGFHVDVWAVSVDGVELRLGRRDYRIREVADAYAQFVTRFDSLEGK